MEVHQRPKRLANHVTAPQINCIKNFIDVNNGQIESLQFENAQKPTMTLCETWHMRGLRPNCGQSPPKVPLATIAGYYQRTNILPTYLPTYIYKAIYTIYLTVATADRVDK